MGYCNIEFERRNTHNLRKFDNSLKVSGGKACRLLLLSHLKKKKTEEKRNIKVLSSHHPAGDKLT